MLDRGRAASLDGESNRVSIVLCLRQEKDVEGLIAADFQHSVNCIVKESHVQHPKGEITMRARGVTWSSQKGAKDTWKLLKAAVRVSGRRLVMPTGMLREAFAGVDPLRIPK